MKNDLLKETPFEKLPDFQRRAAERLLSQTAPVKPVSPTLRQWLAWLALSVFAVVFSCAVLHPIQPGFLGRLLEFPSGPFLVLAFLSSGLAAWLGIASSLPGQEPGPFFKGLMGVLLSALFAMPFLFFTPDRLGDVLAHNRVSEWFCFRTVLVIAAPSWAILGWIASRNASFRPGWTAAWLAVSAFLLGTGCIQVLCSHWECWHVLLNHLMPMAFFIFLPILIGSYWFSRWNR